MTSATHWRPTATISALRDRALLAATIREFFTERGVLEVHTPLLSRSANCDAHIQPAAATLMGSAAFLRTSPEHFHKRLLAAQCGPIYELGPVVRDAEQGARHNPEFTLLEWYRPGWDEAQLIDEVITLLGHCASRWQRTTRVRELDYSQALEDFTGLKLESVRTAELGRWAARRGLRSDSQDRDEILDFVFGKVADAFPQDSITVVSGYPASQAAQAVIENNKARRFEIYWGSLELANGYYELTDADELTMRFATVLERHTPAGQDPLPLDLRLLAALNHGLPECAGVALGFDRLLMALRNDSDISEVMSFAYDAA